MLESTLLPAMYLSKLGYDCLLGDGWITDFIIALDPPSITLDEGTP